jgi:hypothetical protein
MMSEIWRRLGRQTVNHDDFFTREIDWHVMSLLFDLMGPDYLYACI